ncbi:MAG: alpha/beta hydrolase family protein [Woeseia sp.]
MNMNKITALACIAMCASPALAALPARAEPYPLEYFALRDVISNVRISPDGNYLGLMKIPNKDGNPIIELYTASDLTREPFRVNADPMEITSFDWVSDTNLVMSLRQKVRDKIEGYNQGVYETRIALVDVKREKIKSFDELGASVWNLLPNEPNKVILSFFPDLGKDSKISEQFRPRSFYEFDLRRGSKRLLLQGKFSLGQIDFDGDGNPWAARGFDRAKREYIWYFRPRGEKRWDEIYRLSEDSFEDFVVEGIDEAKADSVFVSAQNGHDKRGLWAFDVNSKTFDELVYRRSDVDVSGVRFHSNKWTNPDTVVGVAYRKDKIHIEYLDEIEGATFNQLEAIIPYAYYLRITSRSREGQDLTVYNIGPHDPGTYYLLKDGRLQAIGSKQPLVESERLADVKYITYPARDGWEIPGFLTIPEGEPPFPTIILPHGGPYVTETVIYDEWSQMLANNGYLVLQPQYRGSLGYGLEFWEGAFINGGQGGYKMQDDKDDGALYLVQEGLADPDRLAMFGWSYGGYAALIAASRTPQLYQCTIAGAAVADRLMQINYIRDNLRGADKISWTDMWDDSISPINEVEKVNIPILVVHGDVDQRVPFKHARKYIKELERYHKEHKYVVLEGADHFSNTLFFRHQKKLYDSMIDYLKHDCGPGGL